MSLPHYCRVSVWSNTGEKGDSYGLLIQHLSHSEQHLYSWPLEGGSNYVLLHMQTHRYAGTPHTQLLVPALTSLHTTGSCPNFSPHLGKSPGACPATRAWNTHPRKVTKVGGGIGCLWWWGAKRWRVAAVSVWDLEMEKMEADFSEETAKRNVCVCVWDCSWGSREGVDWRVWVVRDGIEEGLNGH